MGFMKKPLFITVLLLCLSLACASFAEYGTLPGRLLQEMTTEQKIF